MPKQPLTADGVENKIAEIYAMTTVNRMAEASAVESSFKTWVSDNFNLSTDEANYLTGMNNSVCSNYGFNCGLAFRNLLGISLIKPTPKPGTAKWLNLQNDIVVSTNGSGTEEVTGSLTFEIEYRD